MRTSYSISTPILAADLREYGDEDETIMIRHACRDQMAKAYSLPDYNLEFDLLKVCCAYII